MFTLTVIVAVLLAYTQAISSSYISNLLLPFVLKAISLFSVDLFSLFVYGNDGFCYLIAFERCWVLALFVLGRYPAGAYVEILYFICSRGGNLHQAYSTVTDGDKCHLVPRIKGSPTSRSHMMRVGEAEFVYGSFQYQRYSELAETGASNVYTAFANTGPYNQQAGTASTFVNNLRSELPSRPRFSVPSVPLPRPATTQVSVRGSGFKRQMNQVSAMEAAKVLLSGMDSLGNVQERLAIVADTFPEGIPTAVAPSDPAYAKLTKMLGPLRYTHKIEAHAAAGTIRRAAMDHASHVLEGAVVGMISPSKQEYHTFPNGVVWEYTDGLDFARRAAHCTRCKDSFCHEEARIRSQGRVITTNSWQRAGDHFKKFGTSSFVFMNIEPNIPARQIVQLMVRAEVWSAHSLFSVDWRVLLGQSSYDQLTGMTTEMSFGKVVSSFSDGGDYVQSLSNVRALFSPTYADGNSLRRTTIFSEGCSTYQELSLVSGGWATRNVPNCQRYYFVKVIMPDATRPVLCLERAGLDRVLATYRTQAIKDKEVAKIVLRQSVVTYSVAGTQVTPRLAITQSQSEALAVWLEVYSVIQDANAAAQGDRMQPQGMTKAVSSSVFAMATTVLKSSAPGVMSTASSSAIEAFLRTYRSEFGEMTLEQMSQRAMEEHFGVKVEPLSLQNVVISAWGKLFSWVSNPQIWLKKIDRVLRDSWAVSFSFIDVIGVMSLLGVQYSLNGVNVVIDCVSMAARISGRQDIVEGVRRFAGGIQWHTDKAKMFWVTVQDSQSLDFQAATIDIVETFFNRFSSDHAASIQEIREKTLLSEEETQELELNAGLPYSDFLSEIKLFLGRFNSHAKRAAMSATLLNAFHHDCRHASPERKAQLLHTLKDEMKNVKVTKSLELGWILDDTPPIVIPIPVRPIDQQDVRLAFDKGSISIPSAQGNVELVKLKNVDGTVDLGPIHALMEIQHGNTVNAANFGGVNYITPDQKGSQRQQMLIEYAALQPPAIFSRRQNVEAWYTMTMANGVGLKPVDDILRSSANLFTGESIPKWIAHVTGLAMGGKSKGFESWVSASDLIIVPTNELKMSWQDNLGKLDPVRRAPVVTQHNALTVKYAARYVIIDEVYAFDPEHLQAIANRHERCKGIITIGDRRQISNVFSPTGDKLNLDSVPCKMLTPTTFVPWDVACVYLNTTVGDLFSERLFCGSDNCEGLVYTLSADGTLRPGEGDIALQGTQAGKELVVARGVEANTAHEAQGRRSNHTVVHALGRTLLGDMAWLSKAEWSAHMGVIITRARKQTIFVVDALRDLRCFSWFDDANINGLSKTLIRGGTAWDLVEPRTESESVWRHEYDVAIHQTTLTEVPLTDPVTIATVFLDGEPVARNEIVANVDLVNGVTFTDVGRATAPGFDEYCIQPRDVPGADEIQALTRAGEDEPATEMDSQNADAIIELLFEEVIDKKIFFSHIANSRRAALSRQTRQQAIDGCGARYESRASTYSYAFLKPEFAKKPSELPGELKAQGVVTASELQQAMFADVCDALTHAWARAMRPGKISPVGLREEEVEGFLSTFDKSFELDIEKQDSSHKPVHILVASKLIDMAAEKLGLGDMATEIRSKRTVRMMSTMFKFVLSKSLASGDPWTLIINKIMAWSSLVSVARVADVRAAQSGDDITLDQEPPWRHESLRDQLMANVGVKWKAEEREQREAGVTFISRAALPGGRIVYKALRTILKYAFRPRNQIQHAGIRADALRIEKLASRHGLQAYAEDRCLVWGGDPVVVFDLWTRALAVARTSFEELPEALKKPEPRHYTIKSRMGGCFGYALAHCVETNIEAINAIATYPTAVNQSVALHACRDAKVRIIFMNEPFALRSKARLQAEMDRKKFSRAFVVAYEDHAVAVVPNTITLHGAFGKRDITWKFTDAKEIMITDFE